LQRFDVLFRKTCLVSLFGVAIIACGSSSLPSTQTTPVVTDVLSSATSPAENATLIPSSVASTVDSPNTKTNFKVAVIVDTLSEPVTRDQAQGLFDEASRLIQPFVPYGFELVDFIEDSGGGSTQDMAGRYLASHISTNANGILLFSFGDGGRAKLQDGYGYPLAGPGGYRNTFVSPIYGENQIYIAVVRYKLKYMACGYGGTDSVKSSIAIGSECRNKPGTACVQKNGYSMCSNAVGNLYTSTPTHLVSSTIIHAFLHSFSPGGDRDNYATPECNARMGYPTGFYDLQESEYYNGICPFVYDDFAASYKP
jgi:hypothetical protein